MRWRRRASSTSAVRSGRPIGPLHGVPVAIKDIIDTADYPTEFGSPLGAGRRPRSDATVVAKLRAAGAVIIGKTVTTEFAYFHPGQDAQSARPNAHARRLVVGIGGGGGRRIWCRSRSAPRPMDRSSGRLRSAACSRSSPTHGLVSRAGVLPLSRTLDHVGAFARSLDDLALILEVIAGHDPADPDTEPFAAPDFRALLSEPPPLPPRFAFVRTPVWDKADADTKAAFEELVAALGSAVEPVDLPEDWAQAWEVHRTIMAAEMAHNLAPLVARGEPSEAMRKLLAHGRSVSAVDYLSALAAARRYATGLVDIFDAFDAIVTPAAPGVAPKGLDSTGDPRFCTLWTLSGLPVLSLPLFAGDGGLPLAAQLVGPPGRDGRLLRTAGALVAMLAAADKPRRKRVRNR